jgi:glucokinase
VDLGGTKLAVSVVDCQGNLVLKHKYPVEKRTPDDSIEQIITACAEVLRGTGLDTARIAGIGVVVPGIFDPGSGQAWAPNLWGSDHIPLGDKLRSRLSCRIIIDSDRTGYVLGEQWRGVARGTVDVVYMAIGTGIGLGIIMGGRVVSGAHGIAGAIGWFAVDPRKKALYHQLGCLEAESAGPAIARKATERLAAGQPSVLHQSAGPSMESLSTEQVVAAARQRDRLALEVLEEVTNYLAMGVANVISILNPQMVVLGGGLMHAADLLFEPLCRQVLDWAQPIAARKTRIELSQLGEDAGLLGAARLVFLERNPKLRGNGT